MSNWDKFKIRAKNGMATGLIDPMIAVRLMENLPRGNDKAYRLYVGLWIASFPLSLALCFIKWYVGLIAVLVIPSLVRAMIGQAAVMDVLTYACKSEEFYDALVSRGLIQA